MKNKRFKIIGILVAVAIGFMSVAAYPYLYTEFLGWQFEHEVKREPLFALIAKNYPEDFARYLKKVRQDLHQENNLNSVAGHSAQLVNHIFYQSLQHAPDDYVVLYLKATLDLYHYLNGQDPRAVVKLENGDDSIDYDLSTFYERKDFQTRLAHLLDTKRFVIEASVRSSSETPDKPAQPLLQGVLTDLGNKFGEGNVRSAFSDKQIPANLAAQVIIGFYANVLGTGKENAGSIMRYIATKKAAQ